MLLAIVIVCALTEIDSKRLVLGSAVLLRQDVAYKAFGYRLLGYII
jgi:hypothetical protein